ncbi:MAG: hypothetical protein LBJ31_02290 [Treponema sp.]|nr:hypothetical protein [Treponema sp.]
MTEGLLLNSQELRVLLPLLKGSEENMKNSERALLLKIERALYRELSIEEIEAIEYPYQSGGTA